MAEKLGHVTITTNPEVIGDYIIYHLPHEGTGIQYNRIRGIVQIGLLGHGAKVIGDIILAEARKYIPE